MKRMETRWGLELDPRWKLEKANWEGFQGICKKRCLTLQVEYQMDVNIFNNKLE